VTPDGVKLHGLYQAAAGPRPTSLDAAIVLHGLSGNFYGSTLNLQLADALVALGIPVVCGNTRGHDGISSSSVGGRARTFGAAFEIVDDCRHDIAGWMDFLMSRRQHQRILLVGHSLGAIKSLYATAHQTDPAAAGVVGLSATRLSHEQFLASRGAAKFHKWFARACELVANGQGDQLMPVEFPFPTWMTAAAYRDKYGPEDRYDWVPLASRISQPVLLLFGERELRDNPAFYGLWEAAMAATGNLSNYQLQTIESADHFYAGVIQRAADAVSDWLQRKFGLPASDEPAR
jgi:pimeloyl-ACP methyl ester carboxylesterase